jgi:hypothetical protein
MAPESWLTASGSLVRTLSEFPGGSQLRLSGAGYTGVMEGSSGCDEEG